MNSITIRAFNASEWERFRDFRLAALKAAPGVFFYSYETEAAYTQEQWQNNIQSPDNQAFGLFDEEKLVGITAVYTYWEGDPSGATAILGASYILPEYRGRSLSRLLFDARLACIRQQPRFKRVTLMHRASNEASKRSVIARGFVPIGREMQTWPDGTCEEEIIYELKL